MKTNIGNNLANIHGPTTISVTSEDDPKTAGVGMGVNHKAKNRGANGTIAV